MWNWNEILKGSDEDIIEAHKKGVHQSLIAGLLSVFSKDKPIYPSKFAAQYGQDLDRRKRFFSIDAYIAYCKFLRASHSDPDQDDHPNTNYQTYTTGTVSLVKELSSPVNCKPESLYDELVHFQVPKAPPAPHCSEGDVEPVNARFLRLFSFPAEETGRFLDSLLYVGPLRRIPERGDSRGLWFRELDGERPQASWSEGLGAWDWMASASDEAFEKLNGHLNGAGSLETGFTVKRDQYVRLEKGGEVFQALDRARHSGLNKAGQELLAEFLAQTSEVRLSLYNERTGLELEPYAMGTGISQVLPIVAASVAVEEGKFAVLEQPELHIHPKLQTTLGDIFLQAANKGAVFLLETHSEHLLLRLLKRIRHTHGKKAPDGLAMKHIDISVNWIGNEDGRTYAIHLQVDEEGSFDTPWPEGFFDERGEELFG